MSIFNLRKTNLNMNDSFSISSFILFLILILVPLDVMINNLDEIPKIIDSTTLAIYLMNVFFIYTIFYVISYKFKFFFNNKYFTYFLTITLVWIILNGTLLPSISGKVDFWKQYEDSFRLRHLYIFKLIITLLITFLIFKIQVFKNNFMKLIFYYFIFLFILNLYFLFNNFLILNKNVKFDVNELNLGKNNIITISFDGINGNIISELINEEKNKKIFRDFDLYSNYIVTFPATLISISSELTEQTDLETINNDNLIINKNKTNFKNIYTYGSYNKIFNGNNQIFEGQYFKNNNSVKLNAFFQTVLFPSFARWLTIKVYYLYEYGWRNTKFYNYILELTSLNFFNDNQATFNDINRISFYEVLEIFNQRNYLNSNTNNAFFFHFNFSHWYILFDENCNYVPILDSNGNINKLQNFEGNVKNTKCILKKIRSIIKSFQDSGIYDENTIIFKSDHGKPKSYHKSDKFNKGINENMRWSVGRYNSFLMIKKKNISKNNINIIDEKVGSKFIYDFYCENLPFNVKCKRKSKNIVFIPTNESAFLNFKDFKKINLDQFFSLYF